MLEPGSIVLRIIRLERQATDFPTCPQFPSPKDELLCGSLSAFRIIQPRLAESSAKRPAMIQEVTSLRRPVNVASGTSQQDVPRTNRNPPT
ncbi:hypothetical protein HZH68_003598 [Vespula germanica]|uniref:Uncharacterized protein n=2 Tax=Vespula TaxID=7451 RepID=A0A834U3E0_VESGE|nr:hypothetical protein HZH66_003229 [Vespula vulgaris]KAF7415109.1 hypothetical protein HZH68_003598 [Vespula germanica]